MAQKGLSSKRQLVKPKDDHPIERLVPHDPPSTNPPLERSSLSSSPPLSSPSPSTSPGMPFYNCISAMRLTPTSTNHQEDRSPESHWQSRSPKDHDKVTTDIDISSTSLDTISGHSSSGRRQAIPISFLVHPTHTPPQKPMSSSSHFPVVLSNHASIDSPPLVHEVDDFSPQEDWSLHLAEPFPILDHQSILPGSLPTSPEMVSTYTDRKKSSPVRGFSSPPPMHHDETAALYKPTEYKHGNSLAGVRDGQMGVNVVSVTDDEHNEAFKDPGAQIEADPLGHPREGTGISAHEASLKRATNLAVRTTKTGKILHRTKKVGVGKKLTAYDRFLQQRSKYLTEHRSELSPQQRMKIIAEEWAVSDKNQHKTRRKSRFLGPDGKLHLPLTSPPLMVTPTDDDLTSPEANPDPGHSSPDNLSITSKSVSGGDSVRN